MGGFLVRLMIFGAGYTASACARVTAKRFDAVAGTTRSRERFGELSAAGLRPLQFAGLLTDELAPEIAQATHLLVSIAPDAAGDPVLNACRAALAAANHLQWICYLSTVGVYGDHGGAWVDEETPCRPVAQRSVERAAAEAAWREFAESKGLPLAILRLSGIYGPGRNAFVNLAEGSARRLVKPGQVFNRIHRDDIAQAFALALAMRADGVFNITDNEPSPPQDVVAFAATLMGVAPPPEQEFAAAQLSPMARSFYGENKRVSNARSKRELKLEYGYPDYRAALTRMWREDSWRGE
jgi:nucleoside-diphosphate-sugar epimerase